MRRKKRGGKRHKWKKINKTDKKENETLLKGVVGLEWWASWQWTTP
jgi:hypothetical protein